MPPSDFGCQSVVFHDFFATPGAPDPPVDPTDPEFDPRPAPLPQCPRAGRFAGQRLFAGPPCALGPQPWESFEDRIIVWPPSIDVGHIVNEVSVEGIIWNTYARETALLQSIQVSGGEGIVRTGLNVGQTLGPLLDTPQSYAVGTNGPPVIDAFFEYFFDLGGGGQAIVGSRGLVILSRPNEGGYAEGRSWATGVFFSDSGKEVRDTRYVDDGPPKRFVDFPASTVSVQEARLLQNTLKFGNRFALSVPLWLSYSTLTADTDGTLTIFCDTADREFLAGAGVLVLKANRRQAAEAGGFTARTIDTVLSDRIIVSSVVPAGFSTGDFVLPIIPTAAPKSARLDILNLRQAKGRLVFEEMAQMAAVESLADPGLPQYLGYDVWNPEPRDPIGVEPIGYWETQGPDWQAQVPYSPAEPNFRVTFRLLQKTRAEREALRNFFDRKKGAFGAFWVRSHKPDLVMFLAASAGSTIISVKDANDSFGLLGASRHVWDGAAAFEVGNPALGVSPGEILLDVPLPGLPNALEAGQRLENFFLVRFAGDQLTLNVGESRFHKEAGELHLVTEAVATMVELVKETPTGF